MDSLGKLGSAIVKVVEDAIGLQAEVDEYERTIGDLLLVLLRPDKAGLFIKHGTKQSHEIELIFREVYKLQADNKELARKLKEFEEK